MNARDYKQFAPGHFYHIYNRGDNKENIFCDEQDYFNFLKRLKYALGLSRAAYRASGQFPRMQPLEPNAFTIVAYCLMPNHFHILIRQNTKTPITKLMTKVCTSYVKYFNKKYDRLGNLFQDTFKSKLVHNDAYVLHLSAYIHLNPSSPFEYQYSSLPDYLGKRNGVLCDTKPILSYFNQENKLYEEYLMDFNAHKLSQVSDMLFDEE